MDFHSRYHQGRVAASNIEKTACVSLDGLWKWLVVPQGVSNIPAWIMQMVSDVLKKKGYCVVFMDDISIVSDSEEEHGRHIRAVIDTLCKTNFKLMNKKYTFGQMEMECVGCSVTGTRIPMLEWKI
jgi:hypothetical protein